MNDREFINTLIKTYLSNAKNPYQATLDNTFTNRLNDIADKLENQEKVLNIIFKKPLKSATTINYLKINQIFHDMLDYEHYCLIVKEKIRNTEEEFELLKRWVENETN